MHSKGKGKEEDQNKELKQYNDYVIKKNNAMVAEIVKSNIYL